MEEGVAREDTVSQPPPFMLDSLQKLLARIDREIARLQRTHENGRITQGTRDGVAEKISDLRKMRLEITQLMSRLERL